MPKTGFELFFLVVETYRLNGHLVLVSDRYDSGPARTIETILVKTPYGDQEKLYKAGCVSFSRLPCKGEQPFCMAIKGIEPDEIPLGSSVWLECRAAEKPDLSRYRKTTKAPRPGLPDPVQVKQQKMETV